MKGRVLLLLVVASALPSQADAKYCVSGKRCGDTCIELDDVCHIDGYENQPLSNTEVALVGGIGTGLALGLAVAAQMEAIKTPGPGPDSAVKWALGSMGVAVGTGVVTVIVGEGARSESGEDPTIMEGLFVGANVLVIAWDVLVLMDITDPDPNRLPAPFVVDFSGGNVRLGLPQPDIGNDGVFLGNILGCSF